MSLSEEQASFVNHDHNNHARLLAGPGTGKSFTSVKYLERIFKNHPDTRVQYITFTRSAVAEYSEKLSENQLNSDDNNKPNTVHGFALKQLIRGKSSEIPYPLRIPDNWETKNIIHPYLAHRLTSMGYKSTPSVVAKLEREMASGFQSLDPEKILRSSEDQPLRNAFLGVWNQHRYEFGYVLLNELTYRAGKMLNEVEGLSCNVDLLIVDEYQDLNEADLELLFQVSKRGCSIIAIGDDDQSIYGWRLAAPHGIRDFLNKYDGSDYNLTISRRCGGDALKIFNQLIQKDPERPRKPDLKPSDNNPDTGVHYLKFSNNDLETKYICKLIASQISNGISPSEIVILVRSSPSKWIKELSPELVKIGVPMCSQVNFQEILANKDVRFFLSILKLVSNDEDSLAWLAILKLTKGVGQVFAQSVQKSLEKGTFGQKLRSLHKKGFSKISGSDKAKISIDNVLQSISEIKKELEDKSEKNWGIWFVDNLPESFDIDEASKDLFTAIGDFLGHDTSLSNFIIKMESAAKEIASEKSDGVRIMTIAQSKGLTVKMSIILGVEEGLIPMSQTKVELGEETRLLYVALTRATNLTIMTWSSQRSGPVAHVGRKRNRPWDPRQSSPLLEHIIKPEDGKKFIESIIQ